MSQKKHMQWVDAKNVLRYLRGTIGYGLRYASNIDMRLQGYVDSDWAGRAMDKKRTSGCFFSLGSAMISWCSMKQTIVALSIVKTRILQYVWKYTK
jgi:hypothetical protein